MTVPDLWRGLIDDAAIFPPGNAPLADAISAYRQRRDEWYADLVGPLVVKDTDLGDVPADVPVSVVLTGGAGALDGVAGLVEKKGLTLAAIEAAVRDLDDMAGNVRRYDAAMRATGLDVPTHVELPGPVRPQWLAAADEAAASGFRLKLRLGHVEPDLIPDDATVAGWIEAALDRELEFKATAGLHRAVRHEPEGGGSHGFLNVLAATRLLLDGATADDAVTVLAERNGATVAAVELGSIRTWFTSFGSCSVTEPLDDLLALDLLEKP